jgi:lincosamide nucleotidyltransferase A/C/D/E
VGQRVHPRHHPAASITGSDVIDADQVLEVLARLEVAGVRAWIGGGWGIDALVDEQSRPHDDLDLAINTRDEARAIQTLQHAGFRIVEDHRPTRFVMRTTSGAEVDLHPVDFTGSGPGVQLVPGGNPFLYPPDGFATGRIAGRLVPCLSAVQQVRFHLGYPPLDKDHHDMRLLRDRLDLTIPPPY